MTNSSLQRSPAAPSRASKVSDRRNRLAKEISYAARQADSHMLKAWGARSAGHLGGALTRRTKNIGRLAGRLAAWGGGGVRDAVVAVARGRFLEHGKEQAALAGETITDFMEMAARFGKGIASAVSNNPRETAPQLLTLVITSLVVSGGPDGDGGAPDLDLMLGIDAHRSLMNHSILMGSALEAGFQSLVDLVGLLYDKLPSKHDPIWDSIYNQAEEYSRAAQTGASLGMAYHLFVDGLIQEAPYKDLPVSIPMEAHQAVFVANAAAEAVDAGAKPGVSKFTGDRAAEETKHKKHRGTRLVVERRIFEAMPADDRVIVERYGAWMLALASGEIRPLTLSQEKFVDVALGKREPQTVHEHAWCKYRDAQRAMDEGRTSRTTKPY